MKKLLIIDGHNVMFRAYYATAATGNLMRNKKSLPTNMIFGFINIIQKVIKDDYTHIVVAFDKGKKTRRHKMYEGYKATRAVTPDEFIVQMPYVYKFLEASNIKYYMSEDYEADDIIGSIANKFYNEVDEIDVLSNDNDLFQLIKEKENQLYTKQKETIKYTEETLFEEKGIKPAQIPDYKGLIGDKSDNLKGVDGIGPISASNLLQKYSTLEEIYSHIDEIKGKTKEKLEAGKEDAFFTKDMATLDPSYPLKEGLDDFALCDVNRESLSSLYVELDFNYFLKKMNSSPLSPASSKEIGVEENKQERPAFSYKIKDDAFDLKDIIKEKETNFLYLEVTRENYHNAKRLGFGLSNSSGSYFIPYDVAINSFEFSLFLGDESIKKAVYDYKKMYVVLLNDNIILDGVVFDLLLASYLINPELTKNDFSIIGSHFGYIDLPTDESVYGKKIESIMPGLGIIEAHVAQKSFVIMETYEKALAEINENGQADLLYNIEIPLSKTLAKMEFIGLRVDKNALDEYEKNITSELSEIEEKIYVLVGHKFNILSPKQLGEVLFDELGLKGRKKTKSGYSTDQSVLEELKFYHPIIELILRYRTLSKLEGTYVCGVKNAMNEKNDLHIHTIYKQTLTDTGRLSSIEPNLQNLPIRNKESSEFRKVFISEDKSVLMSSDYSQIELRVLAHMSKDENLIKAFNNHEDIHEATAKAILGKESVTKEERSSAKAINFGIVYGMSPWGLSQDIGISPKEAENFINMYHKSFPCILPFTQSLIEEAQENGYVTTMFNRRRYIRDINSSVYTLREFSKRTAMNAPIQGSAADILKIAMVKLDQAIIDNNLHAKLILTIHDEIVLNVPNEEIDRTKELVEKVMISAVSLSVPLLVGVDYGNNLYEAK